MRLWCRWTQAGVTWAPRSSLWEISQHTPEGNVHHGDVISHDTENSYVYAESGLVTTVGVKDLVVVQTKDAVLIADRNHVQDVKKWWKKSKQMDATNTISTVKSIARGGKYDSIDSGDRYRGLNALPSNPRRRPVRTDAPSPRRALGGCGRYGESHH